MAEGNDIARGHAYALVYGFIHAVVGFRNEFHLLLMPLYRVVYNIQRMVCRSPVHDNILNVGIVLGEHTLNSTANGVLAVVTGCND